jgi:hypothetical protein
MHATHCVNEKEAGRSLHPQHDLSDSEIQEALKNRMRSLPKWSMDLQSSQLGPNSRFSPIQLHCIKLKRSFI